MSQRHLTKTERLQVEAAAEVLKPWGLQWTAEHGGKHLIMTVAGPKGRGEWRLMLPCTPKNDDDAVVHARQKARRLVAEINRRLGLLK